MGKRAGQPGLVVAAISFALGLLWAVTIHPLHAPDEPAHFQAVLEVRNAHRLPEIHYEFSSRRQGAAIGSPGDATARQWARERGYGAPLNLLPYEAMQPPLYYLVAGLPATLLPLDTTGVFYWSRLVAVAFGAATVYCCWAATRQLAPRAPAWAVGSAALVALLPQFCFNSATVSNDSTANWAGALAFYVWLRGLRDPAYDPRLLRAGACLGLGILAKLTAVALLPGLALLVLFHAGRMGGIRGSGAWLRRAGALALGAGAGTLAVCGWWLVRNGLVYGEISGSANTLRFYQARWQPLGTALPPQFGQWTWETLWGRFDWTTVLLPADWYRQAAYLTAVACALSALAVLVQLRRRGHFARIEGQAALLLGIVTVTLAAGYVQFNLTIATQLQARYLFLLLLPGSLLFTGGLYALPARPALKRLALAAPLVWLATMNAVGLALVAH